MPTYNRIYFAYKDDDLSFNSSVIQEFLFKFQGDLQIEPLMLKEHVGEKQNSALTQTPQLRSVYHYGYLEDEENPNFLGMQNYENIDAMLSNRIMLTIPFNPEAVSGRTISLEAYAADQDRATFSKFNTNWLIIESRHIYSGLEGIHQNYSILDLARPAFKPERLADAIKLQLIK